MQSFIRYIQLIEGVTDQAKLGQILLSKMKQKGIPMGGSMSDELIAGTQGNGMGLNFGDLYKAKLIVHAPQGHYMLNPSVFDILPDGSAKIKQVLASPKTRYIAPPTPDSAGYKSNYKDWQATGGKMAVPPPPN